MLKSLKALYWNYIGLGLSYHFGVSKIRLLQNIILPNQYQMS